VESRGLAVFGRPLVYLGKQGLYGSMSLYGSVLDLCVRCQVRAVFCWSEMIRTAWLDCYVLLLDPGDQKGFFFVKMERFACAVL